MEERIDERANQTQPALIHKQRPLPSCRRARLAWTNPHSQPADAVVAELRSDATRGLKRAEATQRLEQYGPNELKAAPETPWWQRLLEQFENVLVIILLVAIVISVIEWLLQDPRESALPYEAIVITRHRGPERASSASCRNRAPKSRCAR